MLTLPLRAETHSERRISAYQLRPIDSGDDETSSSGKEDSSPESPHPQRQPGAPQYGQYLAINGQAPHQGRARTKKPRSKSLQPHSNLVPWRKSSRPRRGRSLDKQPFFPGYKPEPIKSWTEETISLKPTPIEKKVIPKLEAAKVELKSIKDQRNQGLMSIGATLDKIIAGKSEKEAIPWVVMREKLKHVESVQKQLDKFDLDEVYLRPIDQPIIIDKQTPQQAQQEQIERTKEIQRLRSIESLEITEMTEQIEKLITKHQKEDTIPWKEMRQHLKSVQRVHNQIEKFKIEEVELRHLEAQTTTTQKVSSATQDTVYMTVDESSKGSIQKVLRKEDIQQYGEDVTDLHKQQYIISEDINMLSVAERERLEAQRIIQQQQPVNWRQGQPRPKLQPLTSREDTSILKTGATTQEQFTQSLQQQKYTSVEDTKMMSIQEHEHLQMMKRTQDEKTVDWRQQRQTQEFQQVEDSTRLAIQERQDTEEQQFTQPQPTMWDRGSKKPLPQQAQPRPQQPAAQYPEQPKTYEEAVDVLPEQPAPVLPTDEPTPVMWERGRKKVTTQHQQMNGTQQMSEVAEQQFIDQQQIIEQQQFVQETKKPTVRKTIAPREPEQKMEQVVLKPTPRPRPKLPEKTEEIQIQTLKRTQATHTVEEQPTRGFEEAVDTLEEVERPQQPEAPQPVMWERGKKKPIKADEVTADQPTKAYEEAVDELPEQAAPQQPEQPQPVLWDREYIKKLTQPEIFEIVNDIVWDAAHKNFKTQVKCLR
ncbi:titin-like [Rhagoletis pomonella]|uniref:titin-like n=1 Tax=Rhagoletis pomonella TaxID=28610 RepID=UPI00177CA3F0|nr:titin-like [Rhagoletis pomonella]